MALGIGVFGGLVLCSQLGACGGADSGPPAAELAELDALARGPNRAIAISSALVAPGTVLIGTTDDTILTGIAARLVTETGGCAKTTAGTGTLSVSFGDAATGCRLQTGVVTLSGTATITIAHVDLRIKIIAMLDAAVEGEPFSGELALDTSDGNNFALTAIAHIDGHDFTVLNLPSAVQDSATAVTVTGSSPAATGATPRSLIYTSVTQRFSACHAGGGTLELKSTAEAIDRILTFADDTPQTDAATWTENGNTTTVALPHLSFCPPLPPGTN